MRYINIHEFTNKKEKLMKTRTLLLASVLAFGVSLTANAQNKVKVGAKPGKIAAKVKKADITGPSAGNALVILTADDVWGDGSGYQMLLDADATAYGTIIPEMGPLTKEGEDASDAVYAEFEYKLPENADGARSTANILSGDSYTLEIPAGTYDFVITNPTPDDRVWIASENGNVGGRFDDFVFEEGKIYEFYVHFDGINDATDLLIPVADVKVEAGNVVTWESNAGEYNLRYRPFIELPEPAYTCDFEDEDAVTGWNIIDADEDGNNWGIETLDDGNIVATSYSWLYAALNPDNWLISPEVDLGGTLTLKAAGLDEDNASEVFAVYVNTGDPTDVEAYEKIADDITVTGNWETYSFDLSAYEGQKGHVAIRHYNVTDQFALGIDDIAIYNEAIPEIPEWTVVDGITENTYTIEGLESGTEYEVQVQGVQSGIAGEWTESVRFTAEDAPTGISKVEDTKATAGQWYTINGVKLAGKPTQKGVYINNGRKAVVK